MGEKEGMKGMGFRADGFSLVAGTFWPFRVNAAASAVRLKRRFLTCEP